MSNKKTILIVDDTPENIEAAKAYFANNVDFNFVYATDRKTAEELLPTVNALITDRQIPYKEDDTLERYNTFIKDKDELENAYISHGYILLAKSAELEIPAIMLSQHGKLMVMKIKDLERAKIIASEIKMIDPYSAENDEKGFEMNWNYTVDHFNVLKSDPKAWELGFTKLSEEFKLDEKPREIKSFPLK